MRALRILFFLCRHLLFQAQAAFRVKLVIAASMVAQLHIVQMQDPGDRPVQQPAIMRDDEHRMAVSGQKAFQPDSAFKVEIVGRLVQ